MRVGNSQDYDNTNFGKNNKILKSEKNVKGKDSIFDKKAAAEEYNKGRIFFHHDENGRIILAPDVQKRLDEYEKEEAKNTSSESTDKYAQAADDFDEYLSNLGQNAKDLSEGKSDKEFKMFDFNPKTYSSDLKGFSEAVIKKHDEDGDGELNAKEFVKLMYGDVADKLTENLNTQAIYKFSTMCNLDDKNTTISRNELAAEFAAIDVNFDEYKSNNNEFGKSVDGKFNLSKMLGHVKSLEDPKTNVQINQIKKGVFGWLNSSNN